MTQDQLTRLRCKLAEKEKGSVNALMLQRLYFRIGLKEFFDYFIKLTNCEAYYNAIYKELLKIAELEPKFKGKNLTVGMMLAMAKRSLIDKCVYTGKNQANISLFIADKLLVEPMAILVKKGA